MKNLLKVVFGMCMVVLMSWYANEKFIYAAVLQIPGTHPPSAVRQIPQYKKSAGESYNKKDTLKSPQKNTAPVQLVYCIVTV